MHTHTTALLREAEFQRHVLVCISLHLDCYNSILEETLILIITFPLEAWTILQQFLHWALFCPVSCLSSVPTRLTRHLFFCTRSSSSAPATQLESLYAKMMTRLPPLGTKPTQRTHAPVDRWWLGGFTYFWWIKDVCYKWQPVWKNSKYTNTLIIG